MDYLKIIITFSILFFPKMIMAQELTINPNQESSEISVGNQYYDLILDASPVPTISKFQINSKTFFKQELIEDQVDFKNYGMHLQLFSSHPNETTEVISFNKPFKISTEIKSASEKVLFLTSDSKPLSMTQQYHFNDYQSKFDVITTIKNNSDSPLTFFPTEAAVWDTEIGSSGLPNMNFYLNVPLLDSEKPSYQINQGTKDANEIIIDATNNMLYFRYKAMLNEIELSNQRPWYAVLNGSYTQPQVFSIEHEYHQNNQIEPVNNNFRFMANGAGTLQKDGKTVRQDFNVEKYIASRYILGKVELKPDEEFSFKTIYSSTVCPGPIVKIKNGITYNKTIDIETYENTYLVFGVLGVPQKGMISIEMIDEDSNILERHTALSLMLDYLNQVSKRPGNVVPNLPTVFYHQIGFGLDSQSDVVINKAEIVMRSTEIINVYLTDFEKNNLYLLGKDESPFEEFVVPENDVQNIEGETNN